MTTENTRATIAAAPVAPAPSPIISDANAAQMFATLEGFQLAQRMASALASSTMLPSHYHGNVGNCLMLLDVGSRFARMGISPFTVAQNLVPVSGKFGWQGQFVISVIKLSGKYKTFEFDNERDASGKVVACTAVATEHDGTERRGVKITWAMVEAEGWSDKKGSKWLTIAEQMYMYRAASFFSRIHCPELMMGYQTTEELADVESIKDITPRTTTTKAAGINDMYNNPAPVAGVEG